MTFCPMSLLLALLSAWTGAEPLPGSAPDLGGRAGAHLKSSRGTARWCLPHRRPPMASSQLVFVASWTKHGAPYGIYVYRQDPETGSLTLLHTEPAENAGFVA